MNKKNHLNISHIVGFFFGVVVTVLINWIIFKDPKKITAPGVASLMAICTFSLALYSAFQLKKWVNSKVNEKAFKRSEELLDEFSTFILVVAKMQHFMLSIKKQQNYSEHAFSLMYDELSELQNNFVESNSSQLLIIHSFSHWGVKFIGRKYYMKSRVHFSQINADCSDLLRILRKHKSSDSHRVKTEVVTQIQTLRSNISSRIEAGGYILDGVMKMKYEKLFIYDAK